MTDVEILKKCHSHLEYCLGRIKDHPEDDLFYVESFLLNEGVYFGLCYFIKNYLFEKIPSFIPCDGYITEPPEDCETIEEIKESLQSRIKWIEERIVDPNQLQLNFD